MIEDLLRAAREAAETGRTFQAIAACRKGLSKEPGHLEAGLLLGNVLHREARYTEAEEAYQETLKAHPHQPELWYNLGNALADQGKWEEALNAHCRASELAPELPFPLKEQAAILVNEGRIPEAVRILESLIGKHPDYAEALGSLASVKGKLGFVKEAIRLLSKAIENDPGNHHLRSNRLFYRLFDDPFDPGSYLSDAEQWERAFSPPEPPSLPMPAPPSGNAPLRVGFISADMRDHVVGSYLLCVLENADPSELHTTCYADVSHPDAMTGQLHHHAQQWRWITGKDNAQTARIIREDKLDLLLDLSGHMGGNRLGVLLHQPAPILATQMGFPAGTGLSCTGWRITDAWMDPEGLTESHHTEQLHRIPWPPFCYRAPGKAPEVSPAPILGNGYPTFGCLNNMAKVSERCLREWGLLFSELPDYRLHLLAPGGGNAMPLLLPRFEKAEIAPEKIVLHAPCRREAFMRLHQHIDIALDPLPYNGGITSLDALYMGLPLVTLAAEASCQRHGVSLLQWLGRPEWIAQDMEPYRRIAHSLASSPDTLADLRSHLREELTRSPLMDARGYASAMTAAYKAIVQGTKKTA